MRVRLHSINLLKKKYGGSLKNVLEYKTKIESEVELADNFESKLQDLHGKLNNIRKETGEQAKTLSDLRMKTAKKLAADIQKELTNLGINDSKFEVRFNKSVHNDNRQNENYLKIDGKKLQFSENGIDEIEFFISTNIGEDLNPLSKVASGGEISRIMLSLKTILAKNEKLPLLIFDEIDTGVSGRIAHKVGKSLKDLSRFHQIITITHLPQIASQADIHFSIQKEKKGDRAVTSIKKLGPDDTVIEIAKLMSGEKLTKESLDGAKKLIESVKN